LVIVFSLQGSRFESASRHSVSPAEDIAVGAILLLVAFVMGSGRAEPLRDRRPRRKGGDKRRRRDRRRPDSSRGHHLV
jgi:hypothetical protein